MARSAIFLLGLFIFPAPGRAQISDSAQTDTLGFAEVTARHIRHKGTRDILTVSNKIRNRHINALSMLKEFPAVRYNPVNEQIRINGTDKIAYQINGTDKSAEDIKNLPPDAIFGRPYAEERGRRSCLHKKTPTHFRSTSRCVSFSKTLYKTNE